MPIYEYGCDRCGHIMEVWAKISDPPPTTCNECQAPDPRKLVSRTAFLLKGGGWYAQGYGSGGGGKGGGEPAGKSGGESGGASTGGESAGGGASKEPAKTTTPSAPSTTTSST